MAKQKLKTLSEDQYLTEVAKELVRLKTQGGGWGLGNQNSIPAAGNTQTVSNWILPKSVGLDVISQMFPSNYLQEWDLTKCRLASDQVLKQGYTLQWDTLVTWVYQSSPFIQSVFEAIGAAVDRVEFFMTHKSGEKDDEWTNELCSKPYQRQIIREIVYGYFWGFTGINFDPLNGQMYKYPISVIDPINRMLKESTFVFSTGMNFNEAVNLLFIQPSTNTESFLGWMQPIARTFIQINNAMMNWGAAGRKAAIPIMQVGYPQSATKLDENGNEFNPARVEAEKLAANPDPSKGFVYPYSVDFQGNIQKSIQIDFTDNKSNMNMHKIFQELIKDFEAGIMQMVLGGTLTAEAGKFGTKGLGEVQERKFDAVIESKISYVISVLNSDFLPKISQFYRNMPADLEYSTDRTKKLTMDEIALLSATMAENGRRLTDEFFINNGILPSDFEELPPSVIPEPFKEVEIKASNKEGFFGSLKKKF